MKKILKVTIVFLILFITCFISYSSYAKDIWDRGDTFISIGKAQTGIGTWINAELSKIAMKEVIDFIWGIGLLVIVICTVILGIKYMFVLPAEKSRIKQATTPYIIGVIVIFGALTIWKFMIELLDVKS